MQKDFFKTLVTNQFIEYGNSMYSKNSDTVMSWIRENDHTKLLPVNASQIEKGKFYFMFYDLSGKSSKMEQYNPLFVIDWATIDNKKYLFGININFIPIAIRVIIFNQIINSDLKKFDDINSKVDKQNPITGLSFAKVYKLLKSIGFEWAIRKFDGSKINKTYCVDMNSLKEFVTMSTAKITGVDDGKLLDIWKSKISKQEQREKELIKELLGDYKEMEKEILKNINNISEKEEQLYKSIQFLKTI